MRVTKYCRSNVWSCIVLVWTTRDKFCAVLVSILKGRSRLLFTTNRYYVALHFIVIYFNRKNNDDHKTDRLFLLKSLNEESLLDILWQSKCLPKLPVYMYFCFIFQYAVLILVLVLSLLVLTTRLVCRMKCMKPECAARWGDDVHTAQANGEWLYTFG